MRKGIAEDKEKLKEKLSYIGLNLEKLPKFLTEFTPISFRTFKNNDETRYKVYKYVDVNDIQILLTPTDRLTNLNEKYKLSAPISSYLDSKTEENMEHFATFLKILNDTKLEDIKQIEKEQEKLNENIPSQIKYVGNYAWQIYYSDISEKYFMLVPTNEYNNAALFYLLKKQIESKKARKKEYIFVPISHQEYAGTYLTKSQVTDFENYLWYFTKDWPSIFEVYDKKEKMSLKIVGQTNVYEKIKSNYVITLNNKAQSIEEYKLVKALFILATGLSEDYIFNTKIDDEGKLQFYFEYENEEKNITYENLVDFIQEQSNQKNMLLKLEDKKILKEQDILQGLKEDVERKTEEYLAKQRQIATFLECKKTFIGKVKYYFSNRKKELKIPYRARNRKDSKQTNEIEEGVLEKQNTQHTIEDLIEICTKLEARRKMVKSLKMDEKAQELKKVNLDRKIKNANIYLNEIELHKKSIFEFWKFTNKDELPSLNEGEDELDKAKEKIGRIFDYEEDIEEVGKKVDELQKRKLSKNETDGIFAVKQVIKSAQILNNTQIDQLTEEQKQTLQNELNILKEQYEKNVDVIQIKDFDIFGAISEDKTKLKTINNQKHREVEKDKYKVLGIMPKTELESYINNLDNYLKLIKEAFCKITTPSEMSIYLATTQELDNQSLNIFHLNQNKSIECDLNTKEINLYKINLKENMPILFYSNIIFFDNFYQTLPMGMNLSDEVLINLKEYNLTQIKQGEFKLNNSKDEYINNIVKVNVVEYNATNKK